MATSIVHIIITTDDTAAVRDYVLAAIDGADPDWDLETATIETDGIVDDLLEDEENLDEEAEQASESTETQEEEGTSREGEDETAPRTEPTGKEF